MNQTKSSPRLLGLEPSTLRSDIHRRYTYMHILFVTIVFKVPYIRRNKNKGTILFHLYPKHIKRDEVQSISAVTSTCSSPRTTPIGHTEDDMVYPCSPNLLSFLLKCNTKFLKKYKGSLILGSAYSNNTW